MNTYKSYGFFEEPVEEWASIKDKDGKTILEKFYTNQEKYAFPFQMMAYISRLTVLKNAIKNNTTSYFQRQPITFSIEGNIGTGKSTLVKHLQSHFKSDEDENLQKKYDVLMTERSVYSDYRVFAQMLFDDKKIEDVEFAVYKKWFDEFIQELPPMMFIYIRADPAVSFQRVNKRAREGENTIPLAYLENCHKYHEEWLLKNVDPNRILIIDANEDINENPELLLNWIEQIEDFVDTHYYLEEDDSEYEDECENEDVSEYEEDNEESEEDDEEEEKKEYKYPHIEEWNRQKNIVYNLSLFTALTSWVIYLFVFHNDYLMHTIDSHEGVY